MSSPQAGNINECFRFNDNINVQLFMTMQTHNSVDSLKCYTFQNDLCFAICVFERGVSLIPGIRCALHGSLMRTHGGRRELSSLLTCPSVPDPPPAWPPFSDKEVIHWPLKAVVLALPPRTNKMFWFKSTPPPFQSCPSFRMNVLNFKEAQSNSLYVARRRKLN